MAEFCKPFCNCGLDLKTKIALALASFHGHFARILIVANNPLYPTSEYL